jgi:signal transduction histidine kinase
LRIRDKLYIGIVCYIIAGATVGLLIFWQFKLISEKLHTVAIVNNISSRMFDVRRYEKNYLLYGNSQDIEAFKYHTGLLKKEMDDIRLEFIRQIGESRYTSLKRTIEDYEHAFITIIQNNEAQSEGIRLLFKEGSRLFKEVVQLDPSIVAEFSSTERLFVMKKEGTAFVRLRELLQRLDKNPLAVMYNATAQRLLVLFNEERALVDLMRAKAREVQELTVDFTKREKEEIETMIRRAMIILLLAFLTALFTGLAVSIRFAVTVINPLLRLEETTRRIAEGDFPDKIEEVKGNDELASLQRSFNVMIDRLHQSMLHLDRAFQELKDKQKQLIGAEKLASVGILASGIAHEISNPLTSVLTFATLMLEKTDENDPNREKLSIMVRETVRAREIVRQLLTFAKETPINLFKMDVNKPIEEAVNTLTEQELFQDIEVSLNLDKDLPHIYIDPDRLTQVMLNMLLNATHAIVNRPGKIEITTRKADDTVEIVISDTGVGIPEEYLSRVFDPFFTTKEQTKGTGLGLAVSYGIIKKHGGTISVSSKVGEGTTFTVRLPINGQDQGHSS